MGGLPRPAGARNLLYCPPLSLLPAGARVGHLPAGSPGGWSVAALSSHEELLPKCPNLLPALLNPTS